jgi:hypothetical protein
VYQERLNDWYETHQTAFDLSEGCIGELYRCNDRKICGKLLVPVNEMNMHYDVINHHVLDSIDRDESAL